MTLCAAFAAVFRSAADFDSAKHLTVVSYEDNSELRYEG